MARIADITANGIASAAFAAGLEPALTACNAKPAGKASGELFQAKITTCFCDESR